MSFGPNDSHMKGNAKDCGRGSEVLRGPVPINDEGKLR